MLGTLDHFNYVRNTYFDKGAHFGKVHLNYLDSPEDFVFSEDRRFMLCLSGEIFSYRNFETSEIKNDSKFLLALIEKEGLGVLKDINGQYCAALYDFREAKLILISDRFGTRPLYYTATDNAFIFAPEVKAIMEAGISKEIDRAAVSHLFHFSHLFGHRTLFERVKQLPEASYLTYSGNKVEINKYWDFPESEEVYFAGWPSKRIIESRTDELMHLMQQAMQRNFTKNRNKILLSLSGGLDSRYVAAYAKEMDISPLIAFTMGPPHSEDQMYGSRVAKMLEIEHHPFEVHPANIWKDAKRFSFIADGMSMIYGPIQGFYPLESFYRKSEVTVSSQMCDAIFGGNLWRRKLKTLLSKRKFDPEAADIVTNIFNLSDNSLLDKLFVPEYAKSINVDYREVPADYISRYKVPIHAYINLLMNEHGRRGTLCGNLMNNLFVETRMPSYDNDIMDFAYQLPLKLREYQFVYRRAFTRMFPELAQVKRENYNLRISDSNFQYRKRIFENKLVTLMKNSPVSPLIAKIPSLNRPKYINYNRWFKENLKNEMVDMLLDTKTLSRGIYRKEGVEALIKLHADPHKDYSRLIWQIINLEYFFRNFID